MAYDKKLLAAARRELERERTAHTEELEARRRDIYTREPRIRAIDRELSTTAASVLRAAMESGGDPTAAIEKLRDRNLGLQEERGGLLRQLGLPADYLTDKPLCPKCGDTGYAGSATCECVKARYAKLLKEQLSSVLPIADQNFAKFDMSFYSTRPDGRSGISPHENMEYNLGECKAYAAKFSKNSPNLLLFGSTGLGKTFLSTCADFPWPTTPPSTLWPRMRPSNSAPVTAKPPQNALHATSAPICSLSTIWAPKWVLPLRFPRCTT